MIFNVRPKEANEDIFFDMNFIFQPPKQIGRNRYVGSWTETGWREIPLPFSRESLITVLSWGAGEQSSTYSHQDIARWCDRFHMAWVTEDLADSEEVKAVVGITQDVSAQWELYLVNTYTLEQLQLIQFATVRLPNEWFQGWLRKVKE
jgi:hypothetical protein